jgi:hypothetical protein
MHVESRENVIDYVQKYAEEIGVNLDKYEDAISIFVERKEDELQKDEAQQDFKTKQEKIQEVRKETLKVFEGKLKERQDNFNDKDYISREDKRADLSSRLCFKKKWADNPFRSIGLKEFNRYSFKNLSLDQGIIDNTDVENVPPITTAVKTPKGKDKNNSNRPKSQRKKRSGCAQTVPYSAQARTEQKRKENEKAGIPNPPPKERQETKKMMEKQELGKYQIKTWKIGMNIYFLIERCSSFKDKEYVSRYRATYSIYRRIYESSKTTCSIARGSLHYSRNEER